MNRYFEVREGDTPVKYVLHGEARVARTTADLSGNSRLQRLRVRPGWNVRILKTAVTNASAQLLAAAGVITATRVWNPVTRTFQPVAGSEDLPAGTILWLHAARNAVVGVRGVGSGLTNLTFSGGGDFVVAPGFDTWSPRRALPPAASVWRWSAEAGRWTFYGAALGAESPPLVSGSEPLFVRSEGSFSLDADSNASLCFYHLDHLGSTAVVSDASGRVLEENSYYPFGSKRVKHVPGARPEHYLYTQMERDRESGLDAFPARYYRSGLGRFIQPDALQTHVERAMTGDVLSRPQKLNSYAYVRNNPLRYIDPTGYDDDTPPQQTTSPPPTPAPAAAPQASSSAPVQVTVPNLRLPPGYIPPGAGPPKITFQSTPGKAATGLTLPPRSVDANEQAEANRRALTGQPADPPKEGSAEDVLEAAGKLHLNGQPLQDRVTGIALDPLKRDWRNASTGEKALVISAGVVMAGLGAPALQNKDAVSGLQTLVPKVVVPIPLGKDLDLKISVSTSKPEGQITIGGKF